MTTASASPRLAMIGLGRMGAAMVKRLEGAGIPCAAYDRDPAARDAITETGAIAASDLRSLAALLEPPRAVWIMVPAAYVGSVIDDLLPLLDAGDIVIDGGNSHYVDDISRAERLTAAGIHFLDVGTSGGVFGLERGYCMMIGGDADAVERLEPVFDALAPGAGDATRTPGLDGAPSPAERGWLHCGPPGAGHFVKMVHNGVEYGMMAALAEGLDVLSHADAGTRARTDDAETTPLTHPEWYRYDFDLASIAEVWRRGSVISSWLVDLAAAALTEEGNDLDSYSGSVSDSGEGRWTLQAAIDTGAPAPILATALFSRFSSRGEGDASLRMLSAMRHQFGGHIERTGDDATGQGTR